MELISARQDHLSQNQKKESDAEGEGSLPQEGQLENLFDEADVILGRQKMTDLLNQNLQFEGKESKKAGSDCSAQKDPWPCLVCASLQKPRSFSPFLSLWETSEKPKPGIISF